MVSLPAGLYFVMVYLRDVVQSGILGYTNTVSPLDWFCFYQALLINTGGFLLFCFLPLLPLVVIGLWRSRNLQLKSWLILSFILSFVPLSSVNPYRWILMLVYPFAFYATDALSRLKSIKWKHFKLTVCRITMFYLVLSTIILSFGFIFSAPEKPFFYFSSDGFQQIRLSNSNFDVAK